MDITDYISAQEAAAISGYHEAHIRLLCQQGKLTGAMRKGKQWFIPRISMMIYGGKRKSN